MKISNEKKTEIINLVAEYKKDPNCWPALWISGLGYNSTEQSFFITQALKK
jgi:hypothetical protein